MSNGKGTIIAGYVCAGVSLLFLPPILMIAGVVLGIININKGETGHGVAQIILSLFCGIIGMCLGAAAAFM